MGERRQDKLNWLQRSLPEGLVVDAAWFEKHGYSRGLRNKYVAHGWLDQLARGVYRRPAPRLQTEGGTQASLRWQPVVISLQTLLGCPYTVGGRTALELQGFAHYLSSDRHREIHLYGASKPPNWVFKLKLENTLVFHNAAKLFRTEASQIHGSKAREGTEKDPLQSSYIQQLWGQWEWPLTVSSPERASLELMDEVPQRETFHQADVLMEGLRNLSPKRLHALLVACRSVKVKRMFLWFAERHQHPWLKNLDRKGIDLGHGKRMLMRGGKLDKTFNITVPESLDAAG
jgi:Transcriptional regulator, AbiEi antitoxin, Type IV TA system/Transcriptional regulator, AbiEi antitoxin N-terminal domain